MTRRMPRFLVVVGTMRVLDEMGRRGSLAARKKIRFSAAGRATKLLGGKGDSNIFGAEQQ